MVHIFIANKQSERFPHKNELLLPYTIAWLKRAVLLLNEPCQVYCVGEPLLGIPDSWLFIPADSAQGHLHVLSVAELTVAPQAGDICVQTQLTQPLREALLLKKAVDLCRGTGMTVISATKMPSPEWRHISNNGTWYEGKTRTRAAYYDGRIDAWLPGHVSEIFDGQCPHAVVYTALPFIVDVDVAEDWPSELTALLKM